MWLKPKLIEKQYTITADFNFAFYAVFICVLLSALLGSLSGDSDSSLSYIAGGVSAVTSIIALIWRHIYINAALNTRSRAIVNLAVQNAKESDFQPAAPKVPEFANSSILLLAKRGLNTSNYLKTADWTYVDFSYDVYQKTKNGEYKQATVYYAVMTTKLPRILPNVLFDSKRERGRQFKAQFSDDQRHQLEGDFNQYFDTYFAEGYTVDSLSFITPDVMQAMVAAADYDIEIVQDNLLIYGPMEAVPAQLQTMSQYLAAIKKTLLVTAASYQDDRLPESQAGQTVTPQGMFLKRRTVNITLGTVVVGIYFIVRIVLIFTSN